MEPERRHQLMNAPDQDTIRAAILRKRGPKRCREKLRREWKSYVLELGGYREWSEGITNPRLLSYRRRILLRTLDRQKAIVEMRYDLTYYRSHDLRLRSFRAIGRELGISHVAVGKLWRRLWSDIHNREIAIEKGLRIVESRLSESGSNDKMRA